MRDNPDWPNQALLERHRQYAIAADPDETRNLAAEDPKRVADLTARLEQWWAPKER